MNSPSCVSVDRPDWDIFCAVVDNYGDIGVCWRLARQLSAELGIRAWLWCAADEPSFLRYASFADLRARYGGEAPAAHLVPDKKTIAVKAIA